MAVSSAQQREKEISAYWKTHRRAWNFLPALGKRIFLTLTVGDGTEKLLDPYFWNWEAQTLKARTIRRFSSSGPVTWMLWDSAWRSAVVSAVQCRLTGIHQFGLFRRAFRSPGKMERYGHVVFELLNSFARVREIDLTPDELLTLSCEHPDYLEHRFWLRRVIAPLFAARLDAGSPVALELCRAAVYDKGFCGREMIEGLLYSKQENNWKMVSDLLLAARLQEGLRQNILEAASDCRLDAFVYLMKTVSEHDLLRFPATVRAFDVWTGLNFTAGRPASVRKAFALALEMLQTPERRKQALTDGDPLELYFSLWASGCADTDCALTAMHAVLQNVSGARRCAALYFLENTGEPVKYSFVAERLNAYKDDPAALGALLALLPEDETFALEKQKAFPREPGERRKLFDTFLSFLDELPVKERKLDHPFVAGREIKLSQSPVWAALVRLAASGPYFDFLRKLAELAPTRSAAMQNLLLHEGLWFMNRSCRYFYRADPVLRKYLYQTALTGRQTSVRTRALERIEQLSAPSRDELSALSGLLNLKTDAIRAIVVRLARKSHWKLALLASLRESGDTEKLLLLEKYGKNEKHEAKYTWKNGFGLYTPNQRWTFPFPPSRAADHPRNWIKNHLAEAKKRIAELDALVETHKDDEFPQTCGISQYMMVLGNFNEEDLWKFDLHGPDGRETFDSYPLAEVWRDFFKHHPGTPELWLTAWTLTRAGVVQPGHKLPKTELNAFFGGDFSQSIPDVKFPAQVGKIFALQLIESAPPERLVEIISAVRSHTPWYFSWMWGAWRIPAVNCFAELLANLPYTPEVFKLRAWYFRNAPFHALNSSMLSNYLEAHRKGLISEKEVFRFIFEDNAIHLGWGWTRNHLLSRPEFRRDPLLLKAVRRLADTELEERRELPIDVSRLIWDLRYLPGTEYFVRILRNFGEERFVRNNNWQNTGKYAVLSEMLKMVRPLPGENGDTLKTFLGEIPLEPERLVEAAMFNPAFLEIVGAYLNEPGLASAGWYFHAHTTESFDEEKSAAVARYTPIPASDFNDGAFDRDWFKSASSGVSEKRFKQLYEAAKYISGSNRHRRSRIFTDAVQGKITGEAVEKKLVTTRDKEMLMAYGLLPGRDFRHRYETIQRFAKESKQFGSQRQASEKLAVSIAMGNLSRSAGYADINRFQWAMEDDKFQELAAYFTPQPVSGQVRAFLRPDDSGHLVLVVDKAGKEQKTLPEALRKHARVTEMREAAKDLREQQRRNRRTLENAMISGDVFRKTELTALRKNPLLAPMLENLLWTGDNQIFLLHEWPDGVKEAKIAYPLDLMASGVWCDWQKRLIEAQIRQPFKQVFRELYIPTEEEKQTKLSSSRYEGHQIQPRKAAAILGTRGWIKDDGGLCKVFHKENWIVSVAFSVDWLSPSEVEPPAVGKITVCDRRNGKQLAISDLPGVLFSEVMRDVDLMVSVAHAGGVDPEASHSTVEMRAALIAAMLPLFKLANVRIEKSHAFITGKFGEYNVHLGSGVCHQQTHGMLNILPVHSQTRGRIFLPFADDDPKTSEIVTKILFLAEDDKIKDPSILEQIKGDRS